MKFIFKCVVAVATMRATNALIDKAIVEYNKYKAKKIIEEAEPVDE